MYNSLLSLKIFLYFVLFPQALKPSTNFNISKLKYLLSIFLILSILKLKILSDRTSPFGFFFWELLARVGRDHSTTVRSSVTQVGFKRWPRDKMAFRHWVLFTRRKLSGHFFPACWYRILTSSENLWQNQTRVKSICCGGGLKQLTWPIFLKEKAFAICGLSGSFYPFSDHANHKETGWQTWGLGLDIDNLD